MGRGGSPDDAVVHHDQPLATNHSRHGVELLPDPAVPALLLRLDEGATDVTVAHQAVGEGDTGFAGEAHRGGG